MRPYPTVRFETYPHHATRGKRKACKMAGCAAYARWTVTVAWSWMRGEDSTLYSCPAHRMVSEQVWSERAAALAEVVEAKRKAKMGGTNATAA